MSPNKKLGQHWLRDSVSLKSIADCAELSPDDVVLEIGPGLGTLTEVLLQQAGQVVAVEIDEELAESLRGMAGGHPGLDPGSRKKLNEKSSSVLEIINTDFLEFDLSQLPVGYKVVGNIPYYITSKIVRKLLTAENKPSLIVLLVQKEVAERLAAEPGEMSVLSVAAQFYADVSLGPIIKAEKFDPPPKVDSQVVIFRPYSSLRGGTTKQSRLENHESRITTYDVRKKHKSGLPRSLRSLAMTPEEEKYFFRIVKAGFSQRRKKLRTSLAGGLNISKAEAEELLQKANIDPNLRAQDLSLSDWAQLAKSYQVRPK